MNDVMFDRRLVIASSRIHTCIITCMLAVAVGFGTLTDKSGLRKENKDRKESYHFCI